MAPHIYAMVFSSSSDLSVATIVIFLLTMMGREVEREDYNLSGCLNSGPSQFYWARGGH